MEFLKFSKCRDVKSPTRANPTDAGIDFYAPNDIEDGSIWVGENFCIASGIKVEIPKGWMGLFLNKSSIASKQNLLIGAQVIDTGYAGEVHIDLHNVGDVQTSIKPGQKIAQMILIPISLASIIEVPETELNHIGERGTGGFGSTGDK